MYPFPQASRRYRVSLLLIALLALLVRLWLWNDQGRAWMVFPGDQDEYYRGAIHLVLRGDYYDTGPWLRPPLTSFFLAAIFAIAGIDLPLAMLVQSILAASHPLVLAALTRRLFGSERAALLAALLTAIFLPFASYASQLLSEFLFFYFISLALLLLEIARRVSQQARQAPEVASSSTSTFWARHPSLKWWFAGGLAWGLAALARPVGLYAVPLLLLWVLFENRKHLPELLDRALSWSERLRSFLLSLLVPATLVPACALVLGFCALVLPWTIRNYLVHGHLIVVDTNGGISFWLGNLLTPEERELQHVWNETIPNLAERQQVALRQGIANILADPALFLARMRYKTVSLWQFDARLFAGNDARGVTIDDASLLFTFVSDLQYLIILLFAVLVIWSTRPAERNWAVLTWPLYGTLLCAVTLGHPRLRVPLLVALLVYAAWGLAHPRQLWQRLRASSLWQRMALAGSLLAVAFVLYSSALIPFSKAQLHLALAPLLGAESQIQAAIAADSANYLPYLALGDLRWAEGDQQAALEAYNQAAGYAAINAPLQVRRIELLRQAGDLAAAQQALEALDSVGWDNTELYVWAYDNFPAQPSDHIDLAAPVTGQVAGVYAATEQDGVAFRWTLDRVRLRLDLQGAKTLHLRMRAPQPATPLTIQAAGKPIATVEVGTQWQDFSVPLSEELWQQREIELLAPLVVLSPEEPYARGVALVEVYITR